MCLFLYPANKPKKNKKVKKPTEDIQELVPEATDGAMNQGYPATPYGAPPAYYSYGYPFPYGMEQRPQENEPAYLTKGQWASYDDTLKGSHATAKENGKKIDETKASISGGIAEAREATKHTQSAIKGTHDAIKDTHTAVKNVHDTLKETYDAIKKNHNEHTNKQDGCAAEISKVWKRMEEEAGKRQEAHQRQQNMQAAWNYFQMYRQAEREAEPKPSGSSARTQSSRSSGSRTSQRRRRSSEDRYEFEGQWHQDEELKRTFMEHLSRVFGGSYPQAGAGRPDGNRENHNHFYAFPPPSPSRGDQYYADPSGNWQYPYTPFPGHDDYYDGHVNDGIKKERSPPRRPYNPFMHDVGQGLGGHRPRYPPRFI
ncbi:hypothetical protein F4677DRAFT_400829 [Hypoxylon crocopeplum]|nr:hypothetical protein F4677DRAFT_400829 [Hypoxylon crocopeplum]